MARPNWTEQELKALHEWAKQDASKRISLTALGKTIQRSYSSAFNQLTRQGLAWTLSARPQLQSPKNNKKQAKDSQKTAKELSELRAQVKAMTERKYIPVHSFFESPFKVGVIGDMHLGSLYERLDLLRAAYDTFEHEKVAHVYHTGDLCDGEKMYRGHEYEIAVHGADAQIKHCVKVYPSKPGIITYFITGNHDLAFWKQSGLDIGEKIAQERSDLVYLGRELADVLIGPEKKKVRLRLVHPGKGTAYALSYHPQKYMDALSGGQKPEIILMGHYHKAEMLPCYRNIHFLQTGCLQAQTPYMQRQSLAAHLGYWILEFTVDRPRLISRFKTEFFAIYEGREALEL